MIDTAQLPAQLAALGLTARLRCAFGVERLPAGLRVVVGIGER